MSLQKLNTGVLFRGPHHAFTRNPPARLHVCSAFTQTTQIVGRKPNHGKSAHRTILQFRYQPVKDHSAQTQSQACQIPTNSPQIGSWPQEDLEVSQQSSQVQDQRLHVRDLGSYRKLLLPLVVSQANTSEGTQSKFASKF